MVYTLVIETDDHGMIKSAKGRKATRDDLSRAAIKDYIRLAAGEGTILSNIVKKIK